VPISNRTLRTALSPVCILLFVASAFAATVTGTITNRTTGKPSAGDTIAVINTAQGMDELSKVTSDAQGHFTATAPDGGQILLHVTHKGAEYFKTVPPGNAPVDIDVYDSAAKVEGITGEALVLRAETDSTGKMLTVAENFFIQNTSAPPRTQFGANTFEFYLPKGAVISQTLANAPGGLPTTADVKTIDAATGHYAFTFPIRPGETRFQVAYSLPYSGKQAFSIKLSVPTGDFAVMLPKTMLFQPTSAFQPINPDVNALSYDAHQPPVGQPVQFALSGTGQLPQDQAEGSGSGGNGPQSGNAPTQASSGERPGGGLGVPDDPGAVNDPWSKYKWLIIGGLGLILFAAAGIMLARSRTPLAASAVPSPAPDFSATPSVYAAASSTSVAASTAAPTQGSLLQTLKDELFELETDRLAGRLNETEYAQHKAAFDVVLRRALGRIEPGRPASNS
jgi:hypothetical protein